MKTPWSLEDVVEIRFILLSVGAVWPGADSPPAGFALLGSIGISLGDGPIRCSASVGPLWAVVERSGLGEW